MLWPLWRLLRIWSNHFSRGDLHRWLAAHRARASGVVLNVGSGGEASRLVEPCLSIDIDPARNPDLVADVCDLRPHFGDATFDAVFLIEVLEHVTEPARAIAEIRRVLKPGGSLVLSVPYLFEIHDAPHDYWRFTRYGIERLLHDFADVTIEARNGYFRAVYTPLIRLWYSPYLGDRVAGLCFMAIAVPLYPLIRLLDAVIRSDRAVTGYHVTARKPLTDASGAPMEVRDR